MEEAIAVLEKRVAIDRALRDGSIESDYDKFCENECLAIEKVINGYRGLEAKVKRYEKYLENKDKKFEEALEYEYQERETDYISKSQIKAKIEEVEKEKDETYTKFLGCNRNNDTLSTKGKMLEGAMQVLQELMGEK